MQGKAGSKNFMDEVELWIYWLDFSKSSYFCTCAHINTNKLNVTKTSYQRNLNVYEKVLVMIRYHFTPTD